MTDEVSQIQFDFDFARTWLDLECVCVRALGMVRTYGNRLGNLKKFRKAKRKKGKKGRCPEDAGLASVNVYSPVEASDTREEREYAAAAMVTAADAVSDGVQLMYMDKTRHWKVRATWVGKLRPPCGRYSNLQMSY